MTISHEADASLVVRDFVEADGYAPLVALLSDEAEETRLDLVLAIWTRVIAAEANDEFAGDRLFVAERADRLVGVAGATISAGRLAGVRPPVWRENEGESVRDALFRSIEASLDAADAATTFISRPAAEALDQSDSPSLFLLDGEAWRRASDCELAAFGFRDRVELDVLAHDLTEVLQADPPPKARWTWRDASALTATELLELVEATYEGSLDCPVLNGRRSVADVLAGYRCEGEVAVWEVAFDGEAPVGCSFLADHPETRSMELLYFGVRPSVRGAGLGQAIVRRALLTGVNRGRSALALSADRANGPAGEIYRKLGFVRVDRRRVFLKFSETVAEGVRATIHDRSE